MSMQLKWNMTGLIAFILLGGAVYVWGPGWGTALRAVFSGLLYAAVFFACFVVIRRK